MLVNIILLIVGLFMLVKGSDLFVSNSAQLAKKLGVSNFIIGLTVVAVGTSLPELSSAIFASIFKSSELILGNVVGANIVNICLIIGLSSLFGVIKTTPIMWERDGFIMLFVGIIFYMGILKGSLFRIEGILLLFLFFVYILFLSSIKEKYEEKFKFKSFLNYFLRFSYISTIRSYRDQIKNYYNNHHKKKKTKITAKKRKEFYLFKEGLIENFLVIAVGLAALIYGADLVVQNAINLSKIFNISERLIGLTIISFGTTLPELSVSISAIRKGLGNILIGNIVGSNIANILLVIGVATLINPLKIGLQTIYYTAPFMIAMMILLLVFIRTGWRIKKFEGIILILLYIVFLTAGLRFGLI